MLMIEIYFLPQKNCFFFGGGDLELCLRSRSSMLQNHGLLWNLSLETLAPMANYDPMECDNCWTEVHQPENGC